MSRGVKKDGVGRMGDYRCRRVVGLNGATEGSWFHLAPLILNEIHLWGVNFVPMSEHHPQNSDLVGVGGAWAPILYQIPTRESFAHLWSITTSMVTMPILYLKLE